MSNSTRDFARPQSPPGNSTASYGPATRRFSRGNWMVTLAVTGAAVAYVMLVFLPGQKAIGQLQQQVQEKQDFLAETASVAPALLAAQDQLARAKSHEAAWREQAPDRTSLSALYGRIYELAGKAGATTTRFDPEPLVELERVTQVPIAVGVNGSFTCLYEFLRGLDALPVSIWVENVQFEKKATDGEGVDCQINAVIFADNPESSDYAERSK